MYGGRDRNDYVFETYRLCVRPCFGGIPNCWDGMGSDYGIGRY